MSEQREQYPMPLMHNATQACVAWNEWCEHGEQPQPDPQAIPEVIELGEPEQVQARIRAKYGFTPTPEYCRDLLAFVEELARDMVL